MKLSPNDDCLCGSRKKFKKCCLPRNGLTEIEHAEVLAYREENGRQRAKRSPRSANFPHMLMFSHLYSYRD